MNWTRKAPTVAGWYWWKRPGYEPAIAEVYGPPGGLLLWLPGEDTTREESISVSGAYDDTEFLGPITPDSYQQGRVAGLRQAGEAYIKYLMNPEYRKSWKTFDEWCRWMAQQAQGEKGVGDGGK